MSRPRFADDYLAPAGIDPEQVARFLPRVRADRVVVKVAAPWFRRLWFRGIVAVAMPWGIYLAPEIEERFEAGLKPERTARLIAHELTHIEQWRRLGGFRHVVQYLGDYFRARLGGHGHWDAYRSIRLEREARTTARLIMGEWS